MLTQDDMRFYIEPAVNQTINAKKILVLDTYNESRQSQYIGAVHEVREDRHMMRGRNWSITTGGDYLFGAAVLENHAEMNAAGYLDETDIHLIAPYEDGFVVGNRIESAYGGLVRLGNVRFSSFNALASISTASVRVPWVAKAASWAYELMPEATDGDAVIEAKLELAKELYKQRRAFNHLHEESISRDWGATMTELMESNDMIPVAKFSPNIQATVITSVDTSDIGSLVMSALREKVASSSSRQGMATNPEDVGLVATISRSFSSTKTYDSLEDATTKLTHEDVVAAWRRQPGAIGNVYKFAASAALAGLAN